ncbi:MAG: EthD family reductase [Gemmatimonadota bacterium]|nr:EthD family reductase [Gemmatimonadota bacterium]
MARMIVIYRTPADTAAFDKHYFDVHIPLAMTLPGLRSYEVSRGPIQSLAGDPVPYLIGTLHFDDLAAIRTAFASPEGQACLVDRQLMAPNDADFQMYLFDSSEA